jgi:hypothetical protein
MKVVVVRGCVDVADETAVAEQLRIERRSGGFGLGSRNTLTRRYHVGERVEGLSADEIDRLAAAGIVRVVS